MGKLTDKQLYTMAKKAAKKSYSPYSKFPVGAAVATKKGHVYIGANVENVSYGLTICAERVAICNALLGGEKDIIAIAVYSGEKDISPCGACRQFILEFGENIRVVYKNNDILISDPISLLIPASFSKEALEKHGQLWGRCFY